MYGAWVAADDEQSIRCTVNLTQGDGDFGDFGPTLSSLDLNKGWWRPTKYTFKDSPVTQDGLRWCRYGTNACRGGTEFYGGGQSYCEPGHKGPLCAVCDVGYTFDANEGEGMSKGVCRACKKSSTSISISPGLVVMLVMLFVVVVVLIYRLARRNAMIMRLMNNAIVMAQSDGGAMEDIVEELDHADGWKAKLLKLKKSLSVKVKILLSFLQIVTSMGFNLGVKFPLQFTNFLSALNFVSFNIFVFIPLGCLSTTPTNFYYELTGITVGVGLVFTALMIMDRITPASNTFYFSAGLTLLFFMLPSVSTTVLTTLACEKFQDIDTSYLKVDLSITCKGEDGFVSANRQFWVWYARFMILVYPIGIPLFFATLLHIHRRDICPWIEEHGFYYVIFHHHDWDDNTIEVVNEKRGSDDPHDNPAQHLVFLTGAYEPHMYWFEVFECLRRLLLSSFLILVDPGSSVQIVVAIIICLIAIKFYSFYNPFVEDSDDHLAEASQWQTFFVFFAALLIRLDATDETPQAQLMLSVLLILIVTTGSVIMTCMVAMELYIEHEETLDKKVEAIDADKDSSLVEVERYTIRGAGKLEERITFDGIADIENGDDANGDESDEDDEDDSNTWSDRDTNNMFQPISAFDNDKGAVDMAKAYAAMQNVFGFSDSTQSAQAAEHTSVEADGIPTEVEGISTEVEGISTEAEKVLSEQEAIMLKARAAQYGRPYSMAVHPPEPPEK